MATTACAPVTDYTKPQHGRQCVKEDPKDTVLHESLKNTTHTFLQVHPQWISVNVFNGSNGVVVPVTVCSIDTISKLQQEVLKQRPDFVGCGSLVYNGKPVELHKTLSELQVKPGAMLITYQKCKGG
ncbi:hypothetical protein cypCar_00019744 [Cyprinus carpio]|uniref:Ubiquitin-like domain-containing protein n=1 Tax=Cyprinus carpio carpio TaxID=630221 RepID=A0A8C1FM50_CYPCA|nr:hypothetical protein cypCar_00019744 [Cyprinus carpio]